MRKKYLSALLFGALLLASAGTFTSCKDYDDDIKNLQEQINTVKTSLDELTTKVNNLGAGIKDFKYENGQLVIVTDKDTNFTVDLPACEGITNLEIKDGVLYADGKAVGSVAGDGGSVVEVKDGVIYIDGEAKAEIGNKVAIVDNGNGTYTLTVDGKEYTLPKAVATDVTVDTYYMKSELFTQYYSELYANGEITSIEENGYGIFWGTSSKDQTWNGPKGSVKAGQLLVGTISASGVKVTPATTELDKMNLKLVDSEGVYAPVTIKAVPVSSSVINSGSRATSEAGVWILSISMDESVTDKNIGSIFTTKGWNYDEQKTTLVNKNFALSCDGRLLSDYKFVIDTQAEVAESADVENALKNNFASQYVAIGSDVYFEKGLSSINYGGLSMETEIPLGYNHPQVYDFKYTISAEDQNDAEKYGITLENNVLKGSSTAANQGISLDLTVMGINGVTYTYKNVVTVHFTSTVVDAEELAETTYKVPVKAVADDEYSVIINLGNTFSGLSAAQAVSLTDDLWSLAEGEENTYLAASVGKPVYYSDAECKNVVNFDDDNDNVKNIKFAKFTYKGYSSAAKPGVHKLQLKLMAGNDEVKKVIAPVNVTIPTFDDMFTKSAAWSDGVAQLRLTHAGDADVMTLYKPASADQFAFNYAKVTYDKVDNKEVVNSINSELVGVVTSDVVSDNHSLKSTKAELSYSFAGVKEFTVKSGKFDVNFISCLDGAVVKNYTDKGVETTFVVDGDNATFANAKVVLNGKKALFNQNLAGVIDLEAAEFAFAFDAKAGNTAKAEINEKGQLTVSGLAANKYETTLTITYKEAVDGKAVYVSMPIKIQVNN